MPIINITMGKTSPETKKALIEELSRAAIEITNIPANEFTVTIQELELENVGRAGLTLPDYQAKMKA